MFFSAFLSTPFCDDNSTKNILADQNLIMKNLMLLYDSTGANDESSTISGFLNKTDATSEIKNKVQWIINLCMKTQGLARLQNYREIRATYIGAGNPMCALGPDISDNWIDLATEVHRRYT